MPPRARYYVVTKGRKPGIYDNWIEANAHVQGVADAVHQSFDDYATALAIWEKAHANGWVKCCGDVPQASSRRPLAPSSSLSAVDDHRSSYSCSEKSGTWYVVTRGRQTGIFTTWIEASSYVEGLPDAVHQSFSSEERAKRVYAEAWIRGYIETIDDRPSCQSTRQTGSDQTPLISTPPLTPVKAEHKELATDEERMPGQLGLSSTPVSSPSAYRPASPAEGGRNTYSSPRKLTQTHSLPTTRLPSMQSAPPVARSFSEQPTGSQGQQDKTPTPKQNYSPQRKAHATVGNPPYLQGYPTSPCRQPIPRADLLLSPLSSSGISLKSVDSTRSDLIPCLLSNNLSVSSRGTSSPQIMSAHQTPVSGLASSRGPSTPIRKADGNAKSPLPFDISQGTPRNHERSTMSPSNTGLAPALVPHTSYGPEYDPRSPASKAGSMPLSMNSASFGRPSPLYPKSTLFA